MVKKMEAKTGKTASLKMIAKILQELVIMERMVPSEGWKTPSRKPTKPKEQILTNVSQEIIESFELV
jgi:hypothetical protein